MSLRGARGCDDEDERCGIHDGRGEAIIMVNGTQVVAGCGEMSDARVRVEQFAGARVFRNFQGLLNPTPNADTTS